MNKEQYIKQLIEKNCFFYYPINIENIEAIYDLFKNNNVIDSTDPEILNYHGIYFYIHKQYDLAKQYYLKAISEFSHPENMLTNPYIPNNLFIINNLASLYENIYQNMEEAKKYYMIAFDHKLPVAANNLGIFYTKIENFEKAEYYFKLAIDYGFIGAYACLAKLYDDYMDDIVQAEKYYLLAINNNDKNGLISIFEHYKKTLNYNTSIQKIILLFRQDMSFEMKRTIADILCPYVFDDNCHLVIDYLHILIYVSESNKYKEMFDKIYELKQNYLSLYYAPGNPGYQETKKNFTDLVSK